MIAATWVLAFATIALVVTTIVLAISTSRYAKIARADFAERLFDNVVVIKARPGDMTTQDNKRALRKEGQTNEDVEEIVEEFYHKSAWKLLGKKAK